MNYYNRQGEPIDLLTWGRLFEDLEYRTIARHYVRGWMISTIWMGLDHGFGLMSRPLIFETMVFPPGDEAEDEGIFSEHWQERYFTEEEAQDGHGKALSWVVEKLGDDAANDIISAAQFSDPAQVPENVADLTGEEVPDES
jgi:hypothetical protein